MSGQAMKSMTGFGRAEAVSPSGTAVVEISSVNKKGLEIVVSLPRDGQFLEPELRELLKEAVSRGRLQIHVLFSPRKTGRILKINEDIFAHHARKLNALAARYKLAGPVPVEAVLGLPGVLESRESAGADVRMGPTVLKAARTALAAFQKSRAIEGRQLVAGLKKQLAGVEKRVAIIAAEAPKVPALHRAILQRRLAELGFDPGTLDERLVRETAFMAERCDISEELVRLRAHLSEFSKILGQSKPGGRNLDFLLQEINREVNTTGSKANHYPISQQVVALKTELEKIREQVQNLE
jgi:uncharacterized protein (TIGR00255 family)